MMDRQTYEQENDVHHQQEPAQLNPYLKLWSEWPTWFPEFSPPLLN